MPVLNNARHERFAQLLAAGLNRDAAYAAAGYRPCVGKGWSLCKREKSIAARVAEIREGMASYMKITAEILIQYAEEARQLAMATQCPAAAVAAIREMGILAGVRVEKREAVQRSVNDLSDAELMAIARGGMDEETPSRSH